MSWLKQLSKAAVVAAFAITPIWSGSAQTVLQKPPAATPIGCVAALPAFTLDQGQNAALTCAADGSLRVTVVSGGGTTGPAIGATDAGSAPTGNNARPLLNGYRDAGGLLQPVAPGTPFPTADANFAATQAPVAPGTATATKSQVIGCTYNSSLPTFTNGQQGGCQVDASGRIFVIAIQSNGASGANSNNHWAVAAAANPLGGGVSTISRIVSSAASTNLTQAKGTAGRLYKVYACNTTTTAKFIKFYNIASASVTVGTSAVFLSRVLPPSASAGVPLCQSFDQADIGWSFSTAISYAITGLNPDNDTTALAAGDVTQVSVEVQ